MENNLRKCVALYRNELGTTSKFYIMANNIPDAERIIGKHLNDINSNYHVSGVFYYTDPYFYTEEELNEK